MSSATTFKRLLAHARRLTTLGSVDEILVASCREVAALTGARGAFGTYCLPGHAWQYGLHIECDADHAKVVSAAARSALFAIQRRLATHKHAIAIERGTDSQAIFDGLGAEVARLVAVPLVHPSRRLWGSFVLVADALIDPETEYLSDVADLATGALDNARRFAFARRDQDRLLMLADATNDAVYDWNFESRDFWWGGGITKLIGALTEPIDPSPRWKLAHVHPDDANRVNESFIQAVQSKETSWRAEYRFRREDGTYIQVEDRGYFLRDAEGRAYRIIGSLQDVTAMKNVLDREHAARMQAEAASRAKDEFLAMLGHELRNPLAPIVTGLDLLRMRTGPSTERELTVLQRQAQHLIHLVDDLLDISRIAHGKIQLKKERLELGAVVAAAVETARPLIESRSHTLSIDIAGQGLAVNADRARLAQVIANLLNNAAKYTEPGGAVAVTARRDGDAIEISVRDNGIGIDAEMLPTIFNMFVQERQSLDRSQGGLGLGLCIVRSLVDLHGGTVEAHSAGRGHGTEIVIRLPAATARMQTDNEAVTQPIAIQRPVGRKIMVVDDNQDAADLLSFALEQLGNTTCVAHDAQAALDLMDEFAPDLAVLDIGLPIMDGYELARLLRNRPDRGPRLIALTGYGQESDKQRAVSAGFDAHLVKPVEIGTLRSIIENLTPAR